MTFGVMEKASQKGTDLGSLKRHELYSNFRLPIELGQFML